MNTKKAFAAKRRGVAQRMALSPSGAESFAARNLELLAAIENTLDALAADTQLLNAISGGYLEIREKLRDFEEEIDKPGRINQMLEKASEACVRIYRDALRRQAAASSDPTLKPADGVTDAYASFIAATSQLHDMVEELREWIATHDAVLQPTTSGVFETVDDLFDSLLPGK